MLKNAGIEVEVGVLEEEAIRPTKYLSLTL